MKTSTTSLGSNPALDKLKCGSALVLALSSLVYFSQPLYAQESPTKTDPFEQQTAQDLLKQTLPLASQARNSIFKGSLFLSQEFNSINHASRFADVAPPEMQSNSNFNSQLRINAKGKIADREQARWLFKAYANSAKIAEGDTVYHGHARIDEAFIDWREGANFLSVGKRRVNWGHARAFTAVNVIAPARDPLNPDFELEGQNMLWLSHHQDDSFDFILTRGNQREISADRISGDRARYGLRWSRTREQYDVALSYFDGGNYAEQAPFARMFGLSFSANLMPGLSAYGEWAQFQHRPTVFPALKPYEAQRSQYRRQILGLLLDLGDKARVFVEIYHNGLGRDATERQQFWSDLDDARRGRGAMPTLDNFSLNRNYWLLAYKKEFLENFEFNGSLILAGDRSSILRAEQIYLASDYWDIRAIYSRVSGSENSEFGNHLLNHQIALQVRAHF